MQLQLNGSRRERRTMTAIRSKTFASDNVLRYLSPSLRFPHFVPMRVSPSVLLDSHLDIHLSANTHSLSLSRFHFFPRDPLCPAALSPFQRPSLSVCLVARVSSSPPTPCTLSPCFLPPLFPSVAPIRFPPPLLSYLLYIPLCCLFQPVSPHETEIHWSLSAPRSIGPRHFVALDTLRHETGTRFSVPRFCFKLLVDCETNVDATFARMSHSAVRLMRTCASFL